MSWHAAQSRWPSAVSMAGVLFLGGSLAACSSSGGGGGLGSGGSGVSSGASSGINPGGTGSSVTGLGTGTGSVAPSGLSTGSSGSVAPSGTSGVSGTGQTTGASVSGSSGAGSGAGTGSMLGGSGAVDGGSASGGGGSGSSGAMSGAGSGGNSGDAGHVMPSAGCGKAQTQALMSYVLYNLTVTLPAGTNPLWANRDYYVWLPGGYDPNRAYTTVFLGPGCGGKGNQVVPVQMASTTNAILIGLDPDPPAEGRPCFNTETPNTPEIPYFDQTLKQVEANYCVDTSRIFIAGFSSGSWLADTIGCVRAGIVRGQGNAAGELQGGLTCTGPIAAMMVHDTGDPANNYMQDYNGARAGILMRNGCTTQTMPYDPGIAPGNKDLLGNPIQCVQYVGCKPGYPLVWCPTTGYGHNDQVMSGLSSIGWWKFWEMLP